jgi:hypothetical protein
VLGVQSFALFGVASEPVYVGCWHDCGCVRRSLFSDKKEEDLAD